MDGALRSTPSFSRTGTGPPCTSMMLHDNSLFSQKNRDLQSKADNYRVVRKVRNEKLKKGLVLSLNPPDVRIRTNFRRCDLWNSSLMPMVYSCSASLNTTAQTSTSAIDSKIERAMVRFFNKAFKRMGTSINPAAVSRERGLPRMHANDAERQSNHRTVEMSVVWNARLSANAQSQRIQRQNEGSAERILRQLEDPRRHQLLRQNENTEQRSIRLTTS
ncbi:hypothetical protein NECAME_11159 [Necator americanus]|uniref:Uncharacterized protein n=1 Tax=Necator americanus TaxID=51031 RepID=W2T811_NECAM|nr:hypothetical protein NECAME_11159 [Necator americanus]ETN77286.1 hypothetical protein NECAME_11159 [Necator americanus]